MRFLWFVIAALFWVFPFAPAQAAPDKELWASISMNDASGKPLLNLTLDGGCVFDSVPVCGVRLEDTFINTPLFSGQATGTARARLEQERVVLTGLDIVMEGARLILGEGHEEIVNLKVTGQGEYVAATGELHLSHLALTTDQELTLSGSMLYAPSGFKALLAANVKQPEQLKTLLGPKLPKGLRDLVVAGPVVLEFGAEGDGNTFGPLGVDITTTATLKRGVTVRSGESEFAVPAFAAKARLRTGARAGEQLEGALWGVSGSARVLGELASGPLRLHRPELVFDMAQADEALYLQKLVLHMADGFLFKETAVPLTHVELSTVAQPREQGGWLLDDLTLSTSGARIQGTAVIDENGGAKGNLRGRSMQLEHIGPIVQAFTGLPFGDWGAAGELDFDTATSFADKEIATTTKLVVRKLSYMSPKSDYMGQGLSARVTLKSTLRLDSHRRWVNADLSIPGGEVLFGSAYLNLNDHPLRFKGNANQLGTDRFKDLKAELDWKGFGQLRATGDLWAPGGFMDWRYRAALNAEDIDLKAAFDVFADAKALKNFQGDAGLEGMASLTLDASSNGELAELKGKLTVDGASLTTVDKTMEVQGASLALPISYRIKGPVERVSSQYVPLDRWGELRAGLVRAPWVEMKNASTRVALVPNRFFVGEDLVLSVLGGTVGLKSIRCDEPLSPEFTVHLDASVQGLDLSQVSGGKFPLEGVLGGNLGTITLTRNALTVPGGLDGDFFGGRLRIEGMYAEYPFEAHRKLGVSMSVAEMDLERISRAMDIGRVTGLLDLDMHDVVVAYGEPVGMLLRAETSKGGDFDKTVSLKAVNSLSVIGTGSGMGDMGVGMFARFFEEFSYSGIGFQCTLNNDIFRVRGLIHDGGVEYLIKKPFLTGINIVNGNPNNYINFKDMLERVERVLGDKPEKL